MPLKPLSPGSGSSQGPTVISERRALAAPEFVGERVESVIHPDFEGLHLTGGFFGSGKTTVQFMTDRPENGAIVDLEGKGRAVAKQIGIKNYWAPVEDAIDLYGMGYRHQHVYDQLMNIVQAIPADRFTFVIFDGVSVMQEAFKAEVEENALNYGISPEKARSGSMGGAWPGVSIIFKKVIRFLQSRRVKVIGMTTELKSKWAREGPIINQFEMKGVSALSQYAILSGITIPGDKDNLGGPAGLVLKEQLGSSQWIDGRPVTRKRLPPKLPLYTMAEVYRYLDHPADWEHLNPREIPSEEETKPFSPIVGKDQLGLLKDYLAAARTGNVSGFATGGVEEE